MLGLHFNINVNCLSALYIIYDTNVCFNIRDFSSKTNKIQGKIISSIRSLAYFVDSSAPTHRIVCPGTCTYFAEKYRVFQKS